LIKIKELKRKSKARSLTKYKKELEKAFNQRHQEDSLIKQQM